MNEIFSLFSTEPRSIAIFSSSWQLSRALLVDPIDIATVLSKEMVRRFPKTTIMMPTFTQGFGENHYINLDVEKATTGIIAETFRSYPEVRRTKSAFFSFSVIGPEKDHLVSLSPKNTWGDESLYSWMLENNTKILTIGLHPTHCSFSHFAEWHHRNNIHYRFEKLFTGHVYHENKLYPWQEILFVRTQNPTPRNDFTPILPLYCKAGMKISNENKITLSVIGAQTKFEVLDRCLQADPYVLISNKEEFISATR